MSIPGSTSLKYRLRDTEHENPDTARKHSEAAVGAPLPSKRALDAANPPVQMQKEYLWETMFRLMVDLTRAALHSLMYSVPELQAATTKPLGEQVQLAFPMGCVAALDPPGPAASHAARAEEEKKEGPVVDDFDDGLMHAPAGEKGAV